MGKFKGDTSSYGTISTYPRTPDKVLSLGATWKNQSHNISTCKRNIEDLYIKAVDVFSSHNVFAKAGLSHNLLHDMSTSQQKRFHEASETFGGGIFNDSVKNNDTLHNGFSAICPNDTISMSKTNGTLINNYIIAMMFDMLLRTDNSPRGIHTLENSIRNGTGASCVDLFQFHPNLQSNIMYSDDDKPTYNKEYLTAILGSHKTLVSIYSKEGNDIVSKYETYLDLKKCPLDPSMDLLTEEEIKYIMIARSVFRLSMMYESVALPDKIVNILKATHKYDANIYHKLTINANILESLKYMKQIGETIETMLGSQSELYRIQTMNELFNLALNLSNDNALYGIDQFGIALANPNNSEKTANLLGKFKKYEPENKDVTDTYTDEMTKIEWLDKHATYSHIALIMCNLSQQGMDNMNSNVTHHLYILAESAAKSFITYEKQIRSWASSIHEQRSNYALQSGSSPAYTDGNYFMHSKFDDIHPIMRLDCMTAEVKNTRIPYNNEFEEW